MSRPLAPSRPLALAQSSRWRSQSRPARTAAGSNRVAHSKYAGGEGLEGRDCVPRRAPEGGHDTVDAGLHELSRLLALHRSRAVHGHLRRRIRASILRSELCELGDVRACALRRCARARASRRPGGGRGAGPRGSRRPPGSGDGASGPVSARKRPAEVVVPAPELRLRLGPERRLAEVLAAATIVSGMRPCSEGASACPVRARAAAPSSPRR